MPRISESIPDLLGGVSQLAPQRREVNEVESMVNCSLRPAEGVVKRPPTKHIAEIAVSATPFSGAFVHTINKNSQERFWVIVLDGDLKVFNAATGVEVPVSFPDGKTYLDVTASPNEAFRLATFNQTTVVVNREKSVGRSSELSAQRGFEALIVVQQTDFDTSYSISISFDGPVVFNKVGEVTSENTATITHVIPAPEGDAFSQARLSTLNVASTLATRLDRIYGLVAKGAFGKPHLLNMQLFGSTIHITAGPDLAPGAEFWVGTQDDLSNQGLQKIQTSTQRIEDLPEEGPVGFRIKVEGDPEKSLDDVFYEFTEFNTWRETNQSGIPIAMDPATLPLELIHNPDLLADRFPSQVPTSTFIGDGPTVHKTAYLETQDGVASTREQLVISPTPGNTIDKFLNLGDANGSPLELKMKFTLDQTHIVGPGPDPRNPANNYVGDFHDILVATNTTGPFLNKFSFRVPFLGRARQFEINLDFGGGVFDFNDDIRLSVVSQAGNLGALTLTPVGLEVTYSQVEIQRISLPDSHYAPGTVMTFTLNGTAFSFTFSAGGTQAAYGAALVTAIEAYGGIPVTAVFAVTGGRGNVKVTNDDGSTSTITLFTFDDNLNSTIQYFNGAADFVNLGVTSGDTLKNLTDVSEAVITGVATTIITHVPLGGGTANAWANGDKGSAETSALSFACREPDWAKRLVGTEETNKWPSFDDETINEVAFLKNRLVLISDENVAMSEVDEFFQFFRSSTLDVLDSDRIDVALSGNKTSSLHSAFTWNETLLTWSELGQFVINGEPFLSPNTVRREATTAYVNTRKVKPVTSERSVYFLTEGNEFTQLWDYRPTAEDASSAEGNRLSVQVPRLMPGTPRGLLAISDPEVVLVLTATDPEKLYVFQHLSQDQTRILGGWHEWSFAGVTQILGIGSIDNEVSLVLERDDGSVHIEVLDLWELSEATVDGQEASDDQTTPPAFVPDTISLGLDTFTEPVDTHLSAHTSDSGFGTWTTNVTESESPVAQGAWCNKVEDQETNKLTMSTSSGAGGYRCSGDIGDGDMHFFIEVKRKADGGPLPVGRFLVNAIQAGTFFQKGMGLGLDRASGSQVVISAKRFHNGGVIESSDMATISFVDDAKLRFGFRRVGLVFSYYTADVGTGANEVARGSFTMGSISTTGLSELSDGLHKGVHIFTESAVDPASDQRWEWDNMTIEGVDPSGAQSTVFTPDGLNPDDFPVIIGVDPLGEEQVLVANGDGTASWPIDDKTGQNIIMGLPVASTIILSKLYHRKDFGPFSGRAEVRGSTYIQNLMLFLESTTTMSMAVAITGHASFSQDLTEKRSLDAEFMHIQIGGRNTEITLTLSHTTADNFKIVGFEWEGSYYHRIRRTS